MTTPCLTPMLRGNRSVCYLASISPSYLPLIIDIQWGGELSVSLVRNLPRPNSHSFILNVDTLPIGYTFDPINNILYFPPNTTVSPNQFAVWTPPVSQDTCGAWVWTASSICVGIESVFCDEL